MKTTVLFAVLAGALCVAGCDEKSSGSATPPVASASAAPTASTPPPPASTAAATPAPSASAVTPVAKPATEEDYEAKASTAVTAPSVDTQLTELDKEIGQ